jgi:hypothetical protein
MVWTAGVQFPARPTRLSLLHSAQTGSGVHRASYPVSTGGCLPGAEQQEREADHSSPFSAQIKNGGAILPLPDASSWHYA